MPYEGYADPVTNEEPGFHSNMPDSELTERVTRAIEASDVSLAPPVVETVDGVLHENSTNPYRAQRGSGRLAPQHDLGCAQHPTSTTPTRPIPRRVQRLDP